MSKIRVYLMGIFTLLMAPAGWVLNGMKPLHVFLQLDKINWTWLFIGIEYGLLVGIFMLILTNTEEAKKAFSHQLRLIKSLNLNLIDILFLSLCAGFGEELLFRVGVQTYLHPILATLFFVAIHGYLLPNDWQVTKYGILVSLFILSLAYALNNEQGLWFGITAHAAYDFVLFYYWSDKAKVQYR